MKFFYSFFIFFFCFYLSHGQSTFNYEKPLDIPLFLSGNFGELRTDHFHTGIDIRTQGVTGKKVYSIDDGYISRIRIQTGGFGKSLYIDHSDGLTSVYAHLDEFNHEIAEYIKNLQYSKKTHTIELFPGKYKFSVKKGELIAYSGNTGNSGGPHLHFEIRTTAGQKPVNVLQCSNFNIIDKTRPVLLNFAVYPIDTSSQINSGNEPVYFSLEKLNPGKYRISGNQSVKIYGKAGFGIEAYDYLDGSSKRCGPSSIELKVNGKTIFNFTVDKLDFNESRYINAHIDYPALKNTKRKINLLYRKPNNRLSLYKEVINEGILEFCQGDKTNLEIIVRDIAGNESVLEANIEGVNYNPDIKLIIPEYVEKFFWNRINEYSSEYMKITIPLGALYEDTYFKYSSDELKNSFYPLIHYIHDSITPIHKSAQLTFKADMVPENLRDKTLIVKINGGRSKSASGGTWIDDYITSNIYEFGVYTLDLDTVPPNIKPINIFSGKDMRNNSSIRLTLDDNLSGIRSYNGYINKQWVLFEFDPKNKLLFYIFDKERLESGKNHELEIYVDDIVGNKAEYRCSFFW